MLLKYVILFLLIVVRFSFGQSAPLKPFDDSQVATIKITVDPLDLQWMYDPANIQSDSLYPCTVRFTNALIDTVLEDVGLRLRGNTSRQAAKKSFKLSFNAFVQGRKFYGIEKLNLNGEHNDPSIIRSKLCWNGFQKIGLKASHAAHAAVYINGAYYGLYIVVEHIDENFLRQYFDHPNGNLWKCLWPADLNYRGDDPENYYPYYDAARPYELKTNRSQYDYRPLAHLIHILNKTPDDEFTDSLLAIFDVRDLFKYFSVNLLLGSWDDYWSLMNNYYLYYDYQEQKFHLIPYDYDNTLGIDFFGIDWANANLYDFPKVAQGYRPLAERLMQNPSWRNVYSHFIQFYRDSIFSPYGKWFNSIDSIRHLIAPFAEADTFRTKDYGFTVDDFYDSYGLAHYENQHVKYGLKEFITRRYYTAGSQLQFSDALPLIYAVDFNPRHPAGNDSIHIRAWCFGQPPVESMTVRFQPGSLQVVQTFAMHKTPSFHSLLAEDRDCWSVTLPPLGAQTFGHFQIAAKNSYGQSRYYPSRGGLKIEAQTENNSPIVINEFLAKNDRTNPDPAGEYDDWVELFNRSDQPVALAGKFLTDNPAYPNKWVFPDTTSALLPGAFRLIWCDDDLNQDGLHANFKLSAGGEFIGLIDHNGSTFLDSLSFGAQKSDVSYGRNPDGSNHWQFLNPSPGRVNAPTSVGASIAITPHMLRLFAFPNPSNQGLTIRFSLPHTSHALDLQIFNIRGQVVWQRHWRQLPSTEMQLHWPATNQQGQALPSGLYLLQLRCGDQQLSRKIILLR